MEVKMKFEGTKAELSRLCDDLGWERRELNHRSRGWNGTVVSIKGDRIGFIEPARTSQGIPCVLEVVPATAEKASQLVVAAFTVGAIEKMKGG